MYATVTCASDLSVHYDYNVNSKEWAGIEGLVLS